MTDQQYPAPPQQKKSPWGCILIGCGVALIIGIVVTAGAVWYFGGKFKQFAQEMEKNPTAATAKLLTRMNPDVEVVETDEDAETITLRNKKTGETVTIDLEDAKQGKIRFFNEKGESAQISVSSDEEGSGTMKIESSDGDFEMAAGTGAAKLPDWVPLLGGGEPENVGVITAGGNITGGYTMQTGDSLEDVAAYFEKKLSEAGFSTQRSSFTSNETTVINVRGMDEQSGRMVNVMVTDENGKVELNLTFQEEKK